MKFVVEFDVRVVKTIAVGFEAESYAEAILKAHREGPCLMGDLPKHIRFEPRSVCGENPCDSWDVLAFCGACSTPILEDHPDSEGYRSAGEDGGYLCPACAKAALADFEARLAALPEIMRKALEGQSTEFVVENVDRWHAGDEATRVDILAFFESDGPEKLRQAKAKHEDGTPLEKGLDPS